jgi:hypothetical protein
MSDLEAVMVQRGYTKGSRLFMISVGQIFADIGPLVSVNTISQLTRNTSADVSIPR